MMSGETYGGAVLPATEISARSLRPAEHPQVLDLFGGIVGVYAGEREVRPPAAPTTRAAFTCHR